MGCIIAPAIAGTPVCSASSSGQNSTRGRTPHMLRDTFAVELLLAGVPIDQVSILLGHASVKTTERHYAPFVKARQEQLVSSVEKSWRLQGLRLVKKHA